MLETGSKHLFITKYDEIQHLVHLFYSWSCVYVYTYIYICVHMRIHCHMHMHPAGLGDPADHRCLRTTSWLWVGRVRPTVIGEVVVTHYNNDHGNSRNVDPELIRGPRPNGRKGCCICVELTPDPPGRVASHEYRTSHGIARMNHSSCALSASNGRIGLQ